MTHMTTHASKRAQQRGFKHEDIEFVRQNGSEVRGGYALTDTDCQAIIEECRQTMQKAEKLKGKFVACREDSVTTAFRPTRRQLSDRIANQRKAG